MGNGALIFVGMMSPDELKTFRRERRWTRNDLARRLGISASRIKDYELGRTRGAAARPAPIPKVIELALAEIERSTRPLSTEEKLALLHDTQHLPHRQHGVSPVDRSVFYGASRGR
jgi:transcriptional regulator with XRE-family HTH domain